MLVNLAHTALAASAALVLAVEARHIVFTKEAPSQAALLSDEATTSCVSYRGSYSDGSSSSSSSSKDAPVSVYIVEDDCDGRPEEWLDSGSLVPLSHGPSSGNAILHVQRAAVATREVASSADAVSWADELAQFMNGVYSQAAAEKRATSSIGRAAQRVLFAAPQVGDRDELIDIGSLERPQLLHRFSSGNSAFFSIPRPLLPIADYFFPSSAVLVSVSPDRLPFPRAQTANAAPAWLNATLSKLHYSPLVDALIADIDPAQIKADVRHLPGEDGKASWRTRHSFTTGGAEAAKWIKATVEKEAGPGVECVFHEHNEGFNPNVICTFKGTTHPDELVILGAHYDSRGSFGHVRAPGESRLRYYPLAFPVRQAYKGRPLSQAGMMTPRVFLRFSASPACSMGTTCASHTPSSSLSSAARSRVCGGLEGTPSISASCRTVVRTPPRMQARPTYV
jgi:hypothetical protein